MYLKNLEINGFKSFAKKSTLLFNSPVVAIVGPNGSGKSNVVEAIRFVLGEQSMKSLRGKSGSDLIFSGSKTLPKQNRATVAITFDNKDRLFSLEKYSGKISLDYDDIVLAREVYSDGSNRYLLNGSEVRLKDIMELLAGVNIGSSGHHIISQGEADRILNANSKERRAMIEDALGLKVYQYRLKESERKLERTNDNMREVELLRKEITPHMAFLKKQVEKISKANEMREELGSFYREWLKKEEIYVTSESSKISEEKNRLKKELSDINEIIEKRNKQKVIPEKTATEIKLEKIEGDIYGIRSIHDEVSRKLGRIEGMIELEEKRVVPQKEANTKTPDIAYREVENLILELNTSLDNALSKNDLAEITLILGRIKSAINAFWNAKKAHSLGERGEMPLNKELEGMKATRDTLQSEINRLGEEGQKLEIALRDAKKVIEDEKKQYLEAERSFYENTVKRGEIVSALNVIEVKDGNIKRIKNDFEQELKEASVLVGGLILNYQDFVFAGEVERLAQDSLKKKIERLKIKLEDVGGQGGGEVIKEYEEVKDREAFLAKELFDLEQSITSLNDLIKELKAKLDIEFKKGIEKINTQFGEFFKLMFDGGTAKIAVIAAPKKKKETEGEELELTAEDLANLVPEEEEAEEGIEIGVSLPKKKVKDLHMLSGGERSLTSIALLFAISQVNPPPFLVLDETDAALDESNSRKYGDMLENLSKFSELIVVTHNRETMSRANILYGITVGSDGASRLLSIKFDEAVTIAK